MGVAAGLPKRASACSFRARRPPQHRLVPLPPSYCMETACASRSRLYLSRDIMLATERTYSGKITPIWRSPSNHTIPRSSLPADGSLAILEAGPTTRSSFAPRCAAASGRIRPTRAGVDPQAPRAAHRGAIVPTHDFAQRQNGKFSHWADWEFNSRRSARAAPFAPMSWATARPTASVTSVRAVTEDGRGGLLDPEHRPTERHLSA